MKIVKALEDFGFVIKVTSKTPENKVKEPKADFLVCC